MGHPSLVPLHRNQTDEEMRGRQLGMLRQDLLTGLCRSVQLTLVQRVKPLLETLRSQLIRLSHDALRLLVSW